MPDPQRKAGYFRYECEMYRLTEDKVNKTYTYKKYTLGVIVREKGWTISHFLYK